MKTGSVAVFNCKPLGVGFVLLSKDNSDIGWDGCLVKKTKITTKGISRPLGVDEIIKKTFGD